MSHRLFVFTVLSLASFAAVDRAAAVPVSRSYANAPDYPCYMRTASGQLMNLGALCAGATGAGATSAGAIDFLQPSPRLPISTSPLLSTPANLLKAREGREARVDDGQYFSYEVLGDRTNSRFTLRYWTEDSVTYSDSQEFRTAQDAVDYFECTIIRKDTTACPGSVSLPRTQTTPRSRSTGTIYGPGPVTRY